MHLLFVNTTFYNACIDVMDLNEYQKTVVTAKNTLKEILDIRYKVAKV